MEMTFPGLGSEVFQLGWRAVIRDEELVGLTKAHGGIAVRGWWDRVQQHSLGWVSARSAQGTLVGFVNVAWDGADHAFLLDTKTSPEYQRRGLATCVVGVAAVHAKAAGCEWLHVDFDQSLATFYFDACRFVPTAAGLINLHELAP